MKVVFLLAGLLAFAAAAAGAPATAPAHMTFARAYSDGRIVERAALFDEAAEITTVYANADEPRHPGGELAGRSFAAQGRVEVAGELAALAKIVGKPRLGTCKALDDRRNLCGYVVDAAETLFTVETTVEKGRITAVTATVVKGKL